MLIALVIPLRTKNSHSGFPLKDSLIFEMGFIQLQAGFRLPAPAQAKLSRRARKCREGEQSSAKLGLEVCLPQPRKNRNPPKIKK